MAKHEASADGHVLLRIDPSSEWSSLPVTSKADLGTSRARYLAIAGGFVWSDRGTISALEEKAGMASARQGEVRVHIDASPEVVWALVADLERMGEWSPECYRVEWLDGARAPATTGARFQGWNRYDEMQWSVICEVKAAEPGRELAWSTVQGNRELVRWRYLFEPADGGTDVTESFEVVWLPPMAAYGEDVLMRDRDRGREEAMRTTLTRIKDIAEAAT